jgi:hypothetical protein
MQTLSDNFNEKIILALQHEMRLETNMWLIQINRKSQCLYFCSVFIITSQMKILVVLLLFSHGTTDRFIHCLMFSMFQDLIYIHWMGYWSVPRPLSTQGSSHRGKCVYKCTSIPRVGLKHTISVFEQQTRVRPHNSRLLRLAHMRNKFWEELIAYFSSYHTDRTENNASSITSIVVCELVAAGYVYKHRLSREIY